MLFEILKKEHGFLNHRLFSRESKPNSWCNFSFEVPRIAPVIARQVYVSFPIPGQIMYCRLGHKTYYHNPKEFLQRLKMIDLAGVLQRLYIWSSMFVLGKCSATSKKFYWVILRTLFKWSLNVNLELELQWYFWK